MQNNNNVNYDNYLDQPVDQNTGEVMERKAQAPKKAKDIGQVAIAGLMKQLESFTDIDETPLTAVQRKTALANVQEADQVVNLKGGGWDKVDFKGCQFFPQLLSASRLGISIKNKEAYIDIRGNKEKKQKDINLKLQYQGDKKILMKYCTKDGKAIFDYADGVVCVDDTFKIKKNMLTGESQIVDFEEYESDDSNYRHNWENIKGAFAIAYFKNDKGEITQKFAYIDKNRLERARGASTAWKYAKDKSTSMWGMDTAKMCIKTAYHELYAILAPFVDITENTSDVNRLYNEEMDWNKENKETKFADSISVETSVKEEVATEKIEDDL